MSCTIPSQTSGTNGHLAFSPVPLTQAQAHLAPQSSKEALTTDPISRLRSQLLALTRLMTIYNGQKKKQQASFITENTQMARKHVKRCFNIVSH